MSTQTETKSQNVPAAIEVYLRDLNRVRATNGAGAASLVLFASVGDEGDYVALLRYDDANLRGVRKPWWAPVAVTPSGRGWPAVLGLGCAYGGYNRAAEVQRFEEIVDNVVDIRDLL